MRISFIIEYYHPHVGGAEVLFQNLAEGLVRAGHYCEVVTSRLPGTMSAETINGVHVRRIWVPRWGDRYWFTLLSIAAAYRAARSADILHTMVYNGAIPAKLAAWFSRKPVVIHVFEVIGAKWFSIGIHSLFAFFYLLMEKLVLAIPFDAYSCISLNTLNALHEKGIPSHKLFLAYPGVDHALFDPDRNGSERIRIRKLLGISEDLFLYTFYGRPGFVKGVDFLIRAVPLVKESINNSKLLLILSKKPASGRQRVMRLVKSLGLRNGADVIILDPVPRGELPSYILAGDCIVIPSLNEGFGFTCVEACSMHVPVVATKAGSLPEVIFGKYVLVEPGSANALAEGIIRARRNDYARSEDKWFTWQDHVDDHIAAYRRLLAKFNRL